MAVNPYTNFDGISFYYDFLKRIVFGNKIDDAQKYFLSMIPNCASVLIIGGGTGKLLVDILQTQRATAITYLELSAKMLDLTKRRLNRYQSKNSHSRIKIDFRQGSVETLDTVEKFDVVFTPFVLDVIEERDLFIFMKKIDLLLHSYSLWFFSDFRLDEAPGLSDRMHRFLMKGMLFFFKMTIGLRVKTLPDFDACFSRLRYKVIQSKIFDKGFIQSKVFGKGSHINESKAEFD